MGFDNKEGGFCGNGDVEVAAEEGEREGGFGLSLGGMEARASTFSSE